MNNDESQLCMVDNPTPAEGSPFAWMQIGEIITRFGERACRIHHARFEDPHPPWFDPSHRAYQGAAHRDGFSVYWEVTIDKAARTAKHPFEGEVAANVSRIEQLTLLS
jgi:hypothetical protein